MDMLSPPSADNQSFKKEQVVEIIGSLIQRMGATKLGIDDALALELHALKDVIDVLKQELQAADPVGIQSHIPDASSELEAIVAMTETATNTIMEACEDIQNTLQRSPHVESYKIEAQIMRIVEACTFQDITGQRISKITKALAAIDKRATELAAILEKNFASHQHKPSEAITNEEVSLLNGPQLPGQGISQAEIDKLLNELF